MAFFDDSIHDTVPWQTIGKPIFSWFPSKTKWLITFCNTMAEENPWDHSLLWLSFTAKKNEDLLQPLTCYTKSFNDFVTNHKQFNPHYILHSSLVDTLTKCRCRFKRNKDNCSTGKKIQKLDVFRSGKKKEIISICQTKMNVDVKALDKSVNQCFMIVCSIHCYSHTKCLFLSNGWFVTSPENKVMSGVKTFLINNNWVRTVTANRKCTRKPS